MKKYRYKKSDAFTSGLSQGNPAALLYTGKDSLTGEEMLDIAKQHKGFVSEVVYCADSDIADLKLTYYSSECEVDFCGHGTIAAMYELLKDNNTLKQKNEIMIETNRKGLLTVFNDIKNADAVYITAPEPQYYEVKMTADVIAAALGVPEQAISKMHPFAIIDAGLRTLLIPISTLVEEISIYPNEKLLKSFCLNNEVDIVLIFCMETSRTEAFAHTRVFAPKFGYLEDPATGSGNSAFGYYMYQNKLWDGKPISIEQGGKDRIYNTIKLAMKDEKVLFGGRATLRIDGYYILW